MGRIIGAAGQRAQGPSSTACARTKKAVTSSVVEYPVAASCLTQAVHGRGIVLDSNQARHITAKLHAVFSTLQETEDCHGEAGVGFRNIARNAAPALD